MRVAAVALVLLALTAGVALAIGPPQPPQPGLTSPTGLVGYVSRGPIGLTCAPTATCFRPARVTLRFARGGVVLARAATRLTGAYRIGLRPGVYSVSAGVGLGLLRPAVVRVPAAGWKTVNFIVATSL